MRYAIRTLLRTPAFTSVAIATIALGIAANSAIFSVVNGVLVRPLPFPDETRLVRVWTTTADEPHGNHSAGDFTDLKRENRSLAAIAGFRGEMAAVAAPSGEPQHLGVQYVTADFFDVLGAPAALGRTFSGTGQAAGEKLVVLSDAGWQELFSRAPDVVGRRVRVNGEACAIVAVMPHGFEWPEHTRLWQLSVNPVPPSPIDVKDPLTNRDSHYFEAIARLKPGVTLAEAQQDLHLIAAGIERQHPATAEGRGVRLVPLREDLTGNVRDALLVIQGAVGLVLLIACANVSSLLIARASGRRRELAIRAALGAGRWDLVRQLLAESIVLGLTGGFAGLVLGSWLVVWLLRLLPEGLPRADAITLDARVAAVTLATSLATGLLFGILPALHASRAQASGVMKEAGERGSSSRARGRAALVIGEIALTLVLLVGAGLLANSFLRLQRVDPGFLPNHVTIAELGVPQTRYPKGEDQMRLYRRLLEGLSDRPELQAVGVGFPGPLRAASASASFFIEGRPSTSRGDQPFAHFATISGGYFAAMGIPLTAGRPFQDRDVAAGPQVAIVSAAMAKKYWPGENPVGKRLRFDNDQKQPWVTVVGLAGDTRQLGLAEAPPPLLYVPYEQFSLPFTTVVVRSSLPPSAVTSLLKAQLAALDPDLPFGDIASLQSVIAKSVDEPKFRALLIATFALLALLLAAVGVYGLISYTVTQRTREIGIRVALGASRRQILMPVVREGVTLAVAGIVLGLAGAAVAMRALTAFLFGVGTSDPLTFSAVALLLLTVAATASYIPSRRALRVDPVVALRAE